MAITICVRAFPIVFFPKHCMPLATFFCYVQKCVCRLLFKSSRSSFSSSFILFCRVQVNPTKLSLCFVPFQMWTVLEHPFPFSFSLFRFRSVYSVKTYIMSRILESGVVFHRNFLNFFLLSFIRFIFISLHIYELNSANSFRAERRIIWFTGELCDSVQADFIKAFPGGWWIFWFPCWKFIVFTVIYV